MPSQDELFLLIQSLSATEKRYFKTNSNAKSNYVQLFEAISAQNGDYDEVKLKKKYAKKPFVKYLSAEKKHLREQIMKQLRAFYAESSIDITINRCMRDALIFKDKGLVEMRYKSLIKAKELALKYERYYLLNEIQSRLLKYVIEFEKKKITDPVQALTREQKQLAIIQETKLELQAKRREIFSLLRSGADMSNTEIKARADILITEVERYRMRIDQSFSLKLEFIVAHGHYYELVREPEKSLEFTIQEYELFQNNPHFIVENNDTYKMCLANLMTRSMTTSNTNWFNKSVAEMKQQPINTFNEEGEVFQNVYFAEHMFYMNQGELERAKALIPAIQEGLEKYKSKINLARRISFQFNIMVMYFVMHEFKAALSWTEPLLNDSSEIKQHQKFVTIMLLPIIHFELGHTDLIDSYTRSAYRFIKRKNRLHEFERLVLRYLKKMPLSVDQPTFKELLIEFNEELDTLKSNPKTPSVLGMEELSLWCSSHLTGKTMAQLLKEY